MAFTLKQKLKGMQPFTVPSIVNNFIFSEYMFECLNNQNIFNKWPSFKLRGYRYGIENTVPSIVNNFRFRIYFRMLKTMRITLHVEKCETPWI